MKRVGMIVGEDDRKKIVLELRYISKYGYTRDEVEDKFQSILDDSFRNISEVFHVSQCRLRK